MQPTTIVVTAPAKINLYLGVGARCDDGYHAVDTVLQTVDLRDTVTVALCGERDGNEPIVVTCDTELDIAPQDNLVYRAASAFAGRCGDRLIGEGQLKIHIGKTIPVQAGLGGGSSDAAATLLACAVLSGIEPTDPRVVEIAASLGSDVPFFLFGGCAHMTGRGDELVERLPALDAALVLAKVRDEGVGTTDAYRRFDEQPVRPGDIEPILSALRRPDADRVHSVAGALSNNMEQASGSLAPGMAGQLATWRQDARVSGCQMCGSGAAFFIMCDDGDSAREIAAELDSEDVWARTVNTSGFGVHRVALEGETW
jgi:4-diphosphocytidyl-2-C-methyl-D-erythritol kinase